MCAIPRRGRVRVRAATEQNAAMRIMGWLPFFVFLVAAAAGSAIGYAQWLAAQ